MKYSTAMAAGTMERSIMAWKWDTTQSVLCTMASKAIVALEIPVTPAAMAPVKAVTVKAVITLNLT